MAPGALRSGAVLRAGGIAECTAERGAELGLEREGGADAAADGRSEREADVGGDGDAERAERAAERRVDGDSVGGVDAGFRRTFLYIHIIFWVEGAGAAGGRHDDQS